MKKHDNLIRRMLADYDLLLGDDGKPVKRDEELRRHLSAFIDCGSTDAKLLKLAIKLRDKLGVLFLIGTAIFELEGVVLMASKSLLLPAM